MLKAHRRTLLYQAVCFIALVVTVLLFAFNPPINALTLTLAIGVVFPAGAIAGNYLRQRVAGLATRDAVIESLETQVRAQLKHNDALEQAVAELEVVQARLDGHPEPLQFATPQYDYIGEGVRARRKRLLREVEEAKPRPTSRGAREAARAHEAARARGEAKPKTRTLYDGRVVPIEEPLDDIEEFGDPDVPAHLDPSFEWLRHDEIGSYEPIWTKGRCKHPPEFVEKVVLGGDDSGGPVVAHLCTKCNSQLPGEGEYA